MQVACTRCTWLRGGSFSEVNSSCKQAHAATLRGLNNNTRWLLVDVVPSSQPVLLIVVARRVATKRCMLPPAQSRTTNYDERHERAEKGARRMCAGGRLTFCSESTIFTVNASASNCALAIRNHMEEVSQSRCHASAWVTRPRGGGEGLVGHP